MIIRVKYQKKEEVKYVGHLDAMRTFTRCLKRTNIPVEYTKGFNPRIQISFALPLGVGVTSDLDYFDLALSEKMNIEMFVAELNSVLPVGFKIVGAEYVEDTKKSLMSLVKEAKYKLILDTKASVPEIDAWLKQSEIWFTKEAKEKHQSSEQINLKPMILDDKVMEENGKIAIYLHTTAGSANNLNPQNVIKALKESKIVIEDYEINREELILTKTA